MAGAHRILLIEDEDNIALALEYLMRTEGHDVRRIASGAEALPSIETTRPDLVLLDVMLPAVSGYDICASVRKDPGLSAVKILMMTAHGTRGEDRRCRDLGADGFIAKPFALSEMKAEVRRLLDARA